MYNTSRLISLVKGLLTVVGQEGSFCACLQRVHRILRFSSAVTVERDFSILLQLDTR